MKAAVIFFITVANFFLTELIAGPTLLQIEETMREKISTLGHGNSFVCVDLGLTNEEFCLIDKFKFDKLAPETTVQYDCFGNLHLLKDELSAFLINIGNNDEEVIQAVTEVISKAVQNVTRVSNKNSAWVCVRASTPTHDFDIPRWHTDGAYYGLNSPLSCPGPGFKFAAVLKGSSTLLYNLPDDMRGIFNSNRNNRVFLSELLDLKKTESPKKGEGVFFIVADNKISAVHSEPKMCENRLFFSILIGDESEINELYLRWHP